MRRIILQSDLFSRDAVTFSYLDAKMSLNRPGNQLGKF